jgi:hypothetical protein
MDLKALVRMGVQPFGGRCGHRLSRPSIVVVGRVVVKLDRGDVHKGDWPRPGADSRAEAASDRPTHRRDSLRASVGSTEASNGRLARVGVVGPKRAKPLPGQV